MNSVQTEVESRKRGSGLVWFRSDLRTGDNPALHQACLDSPGAVTALFVATPQQWEDHDWGPPKVGFALRSVRALEERLARLGIPLRWERVDTFAAVPELIARIARETGSYTVYANRELEVNERRRDREVEQRLERDGVVTRWFDDQTILPPGSLRTTAGNAYSIFTPFHRAWVRDLETRGFDLPLPEPPSGTALEVPRRSTIPEAEVLAERWPGGEEEAERRLEAFLSQWANQYHKRRDDPNLDATSSLSPYLAVGAISVRSLLVRGIEAADGEIVGGDPGITTWMKQLAWRDFYRHVLVAFPRVSRHRAFQEHTERVPWIDDPQGLEAWRSGKTGYPIVDAAMRALATDGWLHNRLRMITASFLAKDLLIDWRSGEQLFSQSLVDTDLANNNGGWQWAASTGTDAAPYFRVFNPWRQSARFDPQGQFIRRFLPELQGVSAPALHDPKRLAAERPDVYPAPIVEHQRARQRAIEAFRSL